MAGKEQRINVANEPELLKLAEEVRRTNEARILGRDGEDLAVIMPLTATLTPSPRRRRDRTQADYEAFLAAAGSWSDVDTDRLVEEIYESRGISNRAPPDL